MSKTARAGLILSLACLAMMAQGCVGGSIVTLVLGPDCEIRRAGSGNAAGSPDNLGAGIAAALGAASRISCGEASREGGGGAGVTSPARRLPTGE